MLRRPLLLTGAVVSFLIAVVLVIDAGLPTRSVLQPDTPAPDFTLPTLDAGQRSLSELRGATVIVNFWATWCVPCRVEMPALQSITNEYANVYVLGINLGEAPGMVQQWVDDLGLTFEILLDEDQRIAEAYGMRAPPATFVITPGGTMQRVFYGPVTASQLRAVLNE